MKEYFRLLKVPVFSIAIFLGMQFVVVVPFLLIQLLQPEGSFEHLLVPMSLLCSSVLTIACIYKLKYVDYSAITNFAPLKSKKIILPFIGTLCAMFATNVASECIGLEDLYRDEFRNLALNPLGMLALSVFGPIAEEFVFRGAIIGDMLKKQVPPIIAILTSSLLFGLIHGNPAQIPFAAIIGICFGVLYVKTNSLVPCCLLHIINNSIATISMNVGNPDETIVESVGSEMATYIFAVVAAVISICTLVKYYGSREPLKGISNKECG